MREEVVRPRVEDYDADAGVADMLNDYHEAQFAEGRMEEEPEATAKAFYVCSGTKTPSRIDKGFSTGCHWTHNDVKVAV
jgi:hypothetical protein